MSPPKINSFGSFINRYLFYQHIYSISTFTCESKDSNEFILRNSKMLRLFKYLIFILYSVILVIVCVYTDLPNQKIIFREIKTRDEYYIFGDYIEFGMTYLCSYIAIIVFEFHHETHKELLTTLNSIDHRLIVNLGHKYEYSRMSRFSFFNILISISQLIINPALYFWFYTDKRYTDIPFIILHAISNNITSTERFTFAVYTIIIGDRLKHVNNKLMDISSKGFCYEDPIEISKKVKDLVLLFDAYRKLCRTAELINKMFGTINLISIAHDFTLFVSNLFLIYLVIVMAKDRIKWHVLLPIVLLIQGNVVRLVVSSIGSGDTISMVCTICLLFR